MLYLVIGIFAILLGKLYRATGTGVCFDKGCHKLSHVCFGWRKKIFSTTLSPGVHGQGRQLGARLGKGCQTLLFLVCTHDRDTAAESPPHPAVGVGLCASQKMCVLAGQTAGNRILYESSCCPDPLTSGLGACFFQL